MDLAGDAEKESFEAIERRIEEERLACHGSQLSKDPKTSGRRSIEEGHRYIYIYMYIYTFILLHFFL